MPKKVEETFMLNNRGRELPGHLIKLTYEGLPLKYEEWDYFYVVGDIPVNIWDNIRDKHEEYMRDPDWMVDELTKITVETLEEAGLKVYTFSRSSEFPAMRNILCDWCRCAMGSGDHLVHYKEDVFCTESCLFEALMQDDEEIVINPETGDLICPHCKAHAPDGLWGESEDTYTVSGEDGFMFDVLACPECGGDAPLITAVMVPTNDPRLLEDSAEAADRLRQLDESPQGKYNPPPEAGAYEYYCPECERIWLDTEPLPSGLCCELHGFVSLRKRLRTVDQTKDTRLLDDYLEIKCDIMRKKL